MAVNETSGFFNASQTATGAYDRVYKAEDFARYFSKFIGTGVFVEPVDQLKVVAGSGLNVIVKKGSAYINGYFYELLEDTTITLSVNSSSYVQTDSIVVRLDLVNRTASLNVKQNSTSVSNSTTIRELQLATIRKDIGDTVITNADITDKRPDESVCGFVKGMVEQISTGELFTQFESMFNTWFDSIKGKLSGDVATNLQNQIDEINTKLDNIPTIRMGTSEPSDAVGKDGDIYIRITE